MGTKSDQTKAYILEKVAPIFNSKGYVGTSLSELTTATGLTKGAIYGNFESKEDLAVKAFKYNINKLLISIATELVKQDTAPDKLSALTNFYRSYYPIAKQQGGCPMLNVGVDTNNVNPMLFKIVKEISKKIIQSIVDIVELGVSNNTIKKNTDAVSVANNFYCMIEGAIFLTFLHKDPSYLENACDHIDHHIIEEIQTE